MPRQNITKLEETVSADSLVTGILLAVLRADEPRVRQGAGALSPEGWEALCVDAERHGIAPFVHAFLRASAIDAPEAARKKLRAAYLRTAEQNVLYRHYARQVYSACERAGIEIIPLKGIFLADRVYDSIALREMSDIDLLVRQEELEKLDHVLVETGFVPMQEIREVLFEEGHHLRYLHAGCRLLLEAHWDLMDPDQDVKVDREALWKRSRPTGPSGRTLRELCPEELLLHLAVHLANHTFCLGLRGLNDLAATIRFYGDVMDWDLLVDIARAWNATRPLYVNLRLLGDLLCVRVPDNLFEKLLPGGLDEGYYDACRELVFASYEPNNPVFALWAERNRGVKTGFMLGSLFPSPRTIVLKYPGVSNSLQILLHYPLYYRDRLKKYSRAFWGLLRGDSEVLAGKDRHQRVMKVKKWLLSG